MDERTMIDVSSLPMALVLATCFLGGMLLGLFYFAALRKTANLIVDGGSPLLGLALTLGRFGVLGAGFYLAVLAGGVALLAALGGFLITKALMLGVKRTGSA